MSQIGKVLNLRDVIVEDQLGCEIANKWTTWDNLRSPAKQEWEEVRKYKYATDTTKTTNSKLPWKNKTTIPKTCQIADNLHANYMATIFPKRKWMDWEANEKESNSVAKRDSILNYMSWVIAQPQFESEVSKLIHDYIDYGNFFSTVEWVDNRIELEDKTQVGYVGPLPRRISPLDIVFNPTAPSFEAAPKIVRSLVSLGDIKEMLERMSTDDDRETYEALFNYMYNLRREVRAGAGTEVSSKDVMYQVDGFTDFRSYLESDYVEVLTFYGDIYDYEKNEFLRNYVITVVDRHKVISKKPNPSFFGKAPIFHVGWRKRQDNLWAMGPLANLIGLQYRIDHIENLKADVFDLIAFPVLKIKGYVGDFEWGPMSRIPVGDDGDVEMVAPAFQVLQANQEIMMYLQMMEEMAGAPKEAMGFRTPGEKTKYEVQRLENAASRIFQSKTRQVEKDGIEPILNACLEISRRNINAVMSIPVWNDEFNITTFQELTANDITGNGRIKPLAARHFAEKAEMIQNLTSFFSSPIGQDPGVLMHFSGKGISMVMEDLLEIKDYEIRQDYVRLSEEADAKRMAMTHEEQVARESQTPVGIQPDDYDMNMPPQEVAPQQ